MRFLARLKTGWALSTDSLDTPRADTGWGRPPHRDRPGPVVYLESTFIAASFSAALMDSAREVFRGRDPTLGEEPTAA